MFDEHVIWKDEKKTSGIRKWNELPSHKRKFLLCKGTYVDKDWKAKKSLLTFWGEWEAQSYFKSTSLKKGISPQFIHKPFLDDSYSGLRKNNTDPFVFGDNFWYTNCKQRKGSFTTRLDNLSMIFFWHWKKKWFLPRYCFCCRKIFFSSFLRSFSRELFYSIIENKFSF